MAIKASSARARGWRPSWSDPRARALLYQVLVLAAVAGLAWFLVSNTLANLAARNISTGFGFLREEAGFAIGESLLDYAPADSYGRAILAGLLNTLRVSAAGIVLATLLGSVLGIARLSGNWLAARVAGAYVEVMRNVPLLLQLFFWYALITEGMPGPRNAHHPLPGVFISNRGLSLPWLQGQGLDGIAAGLVLAIALAVGLHHWAARRRAAAGKAPRTGRIACALLLGLPFLGWAACGGALHWDVPQFQRFNFAGGITLSPEFTALLAGLVLYTSAFVAEVVRSGIQSVGRGQWEAARALGLPPGRVLRLVVLPQALRVIVPPMASQYLNLTKNSSLAVAIGYPDLVSVANTTLNQTGQAVEGILVIMAAYLAVSLSISLFMNWYNRRIALAER